MPNVFAQRRNARKPVDTELASLANSVFCDGMSEEKYKEFKDNVHRPENCEALTNVRLNQLIWDIVKPQTSSMDSKMQVTQTCLAKAGILVTQMLNDLPSTVSGDTLDLGTKALAFLGHGFHNLCLRRRELVKPELKAEYLHLCSSTVPHSTLLFEDDVEKRVKDISDVNKVGVRIATRGPRGKPYSGRGSRGGQRGRGRGGWSGQSPWQWNKSYLNYQGQKGFTGGGAPKTGQKQQKQNKQSKE